MLHISERPEWHHASANWEKKEKKQKKEKMIDDVNEQRSLTPSPLIIPPLPQGRRLAAASSSSFANLTSA